MSAALGARCLVLCPLPKKVVRGGSFCAPLENAVRSRQDRSFMMAHTEVHCRRCGGHLGHMFEHGPKPTGLRYGMNGVALTFLPQNSSS